MTSAYSQYLKDSCKQYIALELNAIIIIMMMTMMMMMMNEFRFT